MIAQVPLLLAAPLALWFAIDPHLESSIRRWGFRLVAVLMLVTIGWDLENYFEWKGMSLGGEEELAIIRALKFHSIAYGALALGWLGASFLPDRHLRIAAALLVIPTLVASPIACEMSYIEQQRTSHLVPFAALVLLPAAALACIAIDGRCESDRGRYAGFSAKTVGAAATIAFFAGLLAIAGLESALASARFDRVDFADAGIEFPLTAVAIIYGCAAGVLVSAKPDAGPVAGWTGLAAGLLAPLAIVGTLLLLMIMGTR